MAVLVIGPLARGNWDIHTDLDLAVVVRNGAQTDIPGEHDRVSAALAEHGEHEVINRLQTRLRQAIQSSS